MANSYGILFDLDGTLIDNEHLKSQAFSKAIEQLGGKSHPSIYKKVMGMSGYVIRNQFITESEIQLDHDEYFVLYKSIYEDLLKSNLKLRLGDDKFLSELKSTGMKLALVSGSYEHSVNWIIQSLDLEQYFEVVINGDDVINKKPAPECFLLALERINLQHDQVIVFEDTDSGLMAAHDAGIRSLGIRHPFNQSHDFTLAFNEYSSFKEESKQMKEDINIIFEEFIL